MKLLITIGSFYPAQKGGPDNSVFNFAKAALKGKDHVQVVCLFDSINDKLKIKHKIKENVSTKIENINIIYFKYYFFRIISPQYYLWLLFNLKKFDIIYINSLFFHISLYCILILNFFKKKIIISPRGELEENALRYKFILKKIYLSVLFFLIHKNTIFLVTSREEKIKTARNLPIRFKINILENLIDLSKPEFTNITNNFFRKNIVYLGRLHPKKILRN